MAATLVACAAAAVGAAGCGSSSSNSSASSNRVTRAAFISTNASGYQMRFTLALNSSALPQPINATGGGAFDVRDHSGALALDMDLGSSPQITQVLGSSTLHMEEVIHGTTVYVKLPDALTSKIPSVSGKPWIKVEGGCGVTNPKSPYGCGTPTRCGTQVRNIGGMRS